MSHLIIINLLLAAAVAGCSFAVKKMNGNRERRFIAKVSSVALCEVIIVAELSCSVPTVPWGSMLGFGLVFGFVLARLRQKQIQREDAAVASSEAGIIGR